MNKKSSKKNIGFIGLGKLGLPVALAIESKGYKVMGYDISPKIAEYLRKRKIPYQEEGAPALLKKTKIKLGSVEEVVKFSDMVFMPIQTPHHEKFEGTTRLPKERADFEYSFLVAGIKDVVAAAKKLRKNIVLVIISTVLPGTIEREIKPLLNQYIHLVYEPLFIAMGTTVKDFLNPEFVLIGVDEKAAARALKNFYQTIHRGLIYETTIKSAELIKVAYNTYIGMKIVFANTVMEICHNVGADADSVTRAIGLARHRLMSPRYLSGGMGDGGGCHPRDNIAMSWLAGKLKLSHNIFNDLMMAREHQTEWLANLVHAEHKKHKLPIIVLGKSFKAGTNLTVGSPATLLVNILRERELKHTHHDPHIDDKPLKLKPAIYFLATKHEVFNTYRFPKGSVVIDPFRYFKNRPGVKVIRIGEAKPATK
ncbi:MAG: nucleotide sugar dehydrogenase [Candidatus Taylorbacteria bacterium]|nr:nucleotide sugar dehydrogenase [Candidatus Taylorbacteria bacterium]